MSWCCNGSVDKDILRWMGFSDVFASQSMTGGTDFMKEEYLGDVVIENNHMPSEQEGKHFRWTISSPGRLSKVFQTCFKASRPEGRAEDALQP